MPGADPTAQPGSTNGLCPGSCHPEHSCICGTYGESPAPSTAGRYLSGPDCRLVVAIDPLSRRRLRQPRAFPHPEKHVRNSSANHAGRTWHPDHRLSPDSAGRRIDRFVCGPGPRRKIAIVSFCLDCQLIEFSAITVLSRQMGFCRLRSWIRQSRVARWVRSVRRCETHTRCAWQIRLARQIFLGQEPDDQKAANDDQCDSDNSYPSPLFHCPSIALLNGTKGYSSDHDRMRKIPVTARYATLRSRDPDRRAYDPAAAASCSTTKSLTASRSSTSLP